MSPQTEFRRDRGLPAVASDARRAQHANTDLSYSSGGVAMSYSAGTPHVVSRYAAVAFALAAGFTMAGAAAAQNPPSAATVASPSGQPGTASKTADADHRLIKPGDRNCLRSTGSLIPPKKGDCLPVAGRSYSRDELRNTGAIDNAHALQMLDPSITLGH
jgi:hypothetical protein